jgi:hypothetical protein
VRSCVLLLAMCRLLLLLQLLDALPLERVFEALRPDAPWACGSKSNGQDRQSHLEGLPGSPRRAAVQVLLSVPARIFAMHGAAGPCSDGLRSTLSHPSMGKPGKATMLPNPVLCRLLPAAAFCKALAQAYMHDQQQHCSI